MSAAPATRGADNADPGELARFGALAARWWDPEGPSRPLHDLNPVRLDFVAQRAGLTGARVLDVGCGGGILSEALARAGARVTALDLSGELLGVARLHLLESGLDADYREQSIAAHADEAAGRYDVVTCMELLEHVPDPAALLADCARALRPGGSLFVSTLNRTARSFALAIVGAEYLLRLLPRGTHRHAAFIRPSELARGLRDAGLDLRELRGLAYSPFTRRARLVDDTSVNYLAHAVRPA